MLAGLFKNMFEPFVVSDADLAAQERLRYYYGEQRPNAILVGTDPSASNLSLNSNTTTYMGRLISELSGTGSYTGPSNYAGQVGSDRRSNAADDRWVLPNNALTKNLLAGRQAACESLGNASSQFGHLSDLAANVDPKSRMRCGWIYNSANPNQGRGAYGTIDGPVVDSSATGTWMWDLAAAKKKFHIYLCSDAGNTCETVDNIKYNGICGFCTTSKKFVPINGSVAAYPYDGNNACTASKLAINGSMCPKPAPPPPAGSPAAVTAAWVAARGPCDPLTNGSLPRDCLVKTAAQAGCSNAGTLITALKSGSDTNYLDTLSEARSYITYQERAANGINDTAMRTGKITVSDALNDFQDVFNAATSDANMGLKSAAADLCFTKGAFDEYDFCTELQPTSKGPFSLDCLQKAFKRAGGQETGSMYPTPMNFSKWNTYNTWNEVNNAIQNLQSNASSPDRAIQQKTIGQFQGIPLDNKAAPQFPLNSLNNVEIFWFTPDTDLKSNGTYNTTFLGRRIRSQIPKLEDTTGVPGGIGSIGSFVYFTNMVVNRPINIKIQFMGSSGFILARNRGSVIGGNRTMPMTNDYKTYDRNDRGNGVNVKNQELSALYNTFGDPNSWTGSSEDWTIQPNVPNILTGYYIGNGKRYNLQIRVVDPNIPENCLCVGKPSADNNIRVYTESECAQLPNSRYAGNGECLVASGGSHSWFCRGLNNQTPCMNQWDSIPGSMLYLIQDPYAPMVSFNVINKYADYNCDFYFMDKRLSSHKMKWKIYGSTGPTPAYSPSQADTPTFPLGLSYMRFANGSGIMSQFQLKIYSFVTLVYIVRFNKIPTLGLQSLPFILWPSYPSIDFPSIFVTGKGNNTAQINVGSAQNTTSNNTTTNAYGCTSPPKTNDGPIITSGNTYMITMTANRTTASDIYSLNSLTVGAALLTDLQNDPNSLRQTSPLAWPNPRSLDNPDSGASDFFLIGGDANCQFDLFSIQMYDYPLTGANLAHAANGDWAVPAANPVNSQATDQNPYV
jgi:hypothetical protein